MDYRLDRLGIICLGEYNSANALMTDPDSVLQSRENPDSEYLCLAFPSVVSTRQSMLLTFVVVGF